MVRYNILSGDFTDYGTNYLSELGNNDGEYGQSVFYTQYDSTTLYTAGGSSGNAINMYDLETLTFQSLGTTIPFQTSRTSCIASSDSPTPSLYIVGGHYPKKLQLLDLDTVSWHESPPDMTYSHSYHGCIVADDRLWAIGGSGSSTVEAININELDFWQYIDGLQCGLFSPAVTAVNGFIYVIGGSCDGHSDQMHVIDTATNSIEIHSDTFSFGRYSFPIVAIDETIYGFGGVHELSTIDSWITLNLLSIIFSI